jgi:uncharacterized membrane protein required for colicin V production
MMSLASVFWLLVLVFAIIGAMRGWSRELLVTFSIILSLFILGVMEHYVPPIHEFLASPNSRPVFWTRTIIVVVLVFFGYQTPNIAKLSGPRFARERLSDSLLGLVLGAINGFLMVGTLWYFLEQSNYPFPQFITAPEAGNPLSAATLRLLPYLAPRWLGVPTVYFAVALFSLFVLVIFI